MIFIIPAVKEPAFVAGFFVCKKITFFGSDLLKMPVKKIILLLFCTVCAVLQNKAQDLTRIESLKDLYIGIPIDQGFDSCKKYIAGHSLWGIDSVKERGIYSSFKQPMKGHFPFPDTALVKVLLAPSRAKAWRVTLAGDTARGIVIEAVLGSDKEARKNSVVIYKQILKLLSDHYKEKTGSDDELLLSKGRNKNFPDCLLIRGFEEEKKFYYVLLQFWGL